MDEEAAQRASTFAERSVTNPDQRTHTSSGTQRESNPNQQSLQHLLPCMTMHPIQPQIQTGYIQTYESPFNLNSLPGVCPFPLNLQTLSSGDRVQPELTPLIPELILNPCSPQETCWMNISPVASTPNSRFGFSPCMLVPHSPLSPPHSRLLLTEVCPSWCLCPRTVPVHQPCAPGLLSRKAGDSVSEQLNIKSAASGKEQSTEKAKSEEKQQENDTHESKVSPGPLHSLVEEPPTGYAEYKIIMDSLCPKIHENEEDEDGEKEKLETENSTFLEYLDELCSDEDFVRKVEMMLNIDYLDSLFSSNLEPLDLLALEIQEQEAVVVTQKDQSHQLSADSNSDTVTGETSQAVLHAEERAQTPFLDPPGTQSDADPNYDGQNASLSTMIKESMEELLPNDALSSLCHHNSLFMDSSCTLSPLSAPDTSDLESILIDVAAALSAADDSGPNVSEDASMSLSNFAKTQSANLSQKIQSRPGDPPASESPSTSCISGSTEAPPAPCFRADFLTDSPPQSAGPPALRVLAMKTLSPAQIKESEEQCSPRNTNTKCSCLKDLSHTPKDDLNNAIPVPATSSFVADSHPDSCDAKTDGSSPGAVPEKQTEAPEGLQISQESVSPGVLSELRTSEWHDIEKKCEKNLEDVARTSVTQRKTATKTREEGMAKMTFEREEKNEENYNLVKIRQSQRLADQKEKQKAGLSSEFKTERAEERKPNEKSVKKMAKFAPERDGVIYEKRSRQSPGGRLLCKQDESNFEERSQGTKITHTFEQFSEMAHKEQHQKLTGEIERLRVEAGEQSEASDSYFCTKMRVEDSLSAKAPRDNSQRDEGRIKRQEEQIQMSSFVRRRTRSMTNEEKVQLTPLSAARGGKKVQHSEMERSETKASPQREMQDKLQVNAKEYANKQSVSSPNKSRSKRNEEESSEKANHASKTDLTEAEDKVSGHLSPISAPALLPPQSPRIQTDSTSTEDTKMVDQGSQKAPSKVPLNERNEHEHPDSSLESTSVETCEKNLKLSPILHPESIQLNQQQSKAAALNEDGVGGHSEATEMKTCDFYNLRSGSHMLDVSKRAVTRTGIHKNKLDETAHHLSSPKLSPDQTAGVKGERERMNGEEAERPSLMLSPGKRYWQERGASEETETRVNETEKMASETEILKSPMKRARLKGKAEVNSLRAEEQKQKWLEKDSETSTGKVPHFPCKKQTRLSRRLPTKYKDFILNKPKVKGQKPKAEKGKTLRRGKKTDK